MFKRLFLPLLLISVGAIAVAQTIVKANQGAPGTQGPWPVTMGGIGATDAGSALVTVAAHGACTNKVMTVGTSGVPCPGDAGSTAGAADNRADRRSIMIELVQTGETLTITTDGTTASATRGISIASGGSYTDNLAGTVSPNCRCTASSCSVQTVECP